MYRDDDAAAPLTDFDRSRDDAASSGRSAAISYWKKGLRPGPGSGRPLRMVLVRAHVRDAGPTMMMSTRSLPKMSEPAVGVDPPPALAAALPENTELTTVPGRVLMTKSPPPAEVA